MDDDIWDFSVNRTIPGKKLLAGTDHFRRLNWLKQRVPEDDLYFLQDGDFSLALFREAAESYIHGQFIAAIVLGYSFIERTIAGRLDHMKDKTARGHSHEVISAARERGWLTEEETLALNQLRGLRNPLVHFREPLDTSRPEIRAILQAKTTSELLEVDAQRVLEAAIHVLRKTAI